jgi:DNA-directed RNA polymerase subunit L
MKLEIVDKDENSMTIKIIGEDHTFCNILRKVLQSDEVVSAAAYSIEHPLLEHPKFYVKVKRGRPETALVRAAGRIIEYCGDLKRQLSRARKK